MDRLQNIRSVREAKAQPSRQAHQVREVINDFLNSALVDLRQIAFDIKVMAIPKFKINRN